MSVELLLHLLHNGHDVASTFYLTRKPRSVGMRGGGVVERDGEDGVATSVTLEEQVVLADVKDIPHAMALLMVCSLP